MWCVRVVVVHCVPEKYALARFGDRAVEHRGTICAASAERMRLAGRPAGCWAGVGGASVDDVLANGLFGVAVGAVQCRWRATVTQHNHVCFWAKSPASGIARRG